MAITLEKVSKINIGEIVSGAIESVRAIKNSEQARKEAEFQKAIAEGTISYDAQIAFREKQLAAEKSSSLSDPEYITQIQTSIGTLKKLKRYQTIRNSYKTSLDNYSSGKGNIQQVIDLLTETLASEQDETLRTELRTQLSSAIGEKTKLETTAINNRITIATKDKSIELIDQSIDEVKTKKSQALLADDKATASMWDATLSSLNSTRATVKIETAVNDINYQVARNALTSGQKLGLLNDKMADSEDNVPVVYNGVRYNSMKEFWSQKTSEYISTSYLAEVNTEIENETAKIASTSAFGQVPIARIEAVDNFYKDLAKRPEFVPFTTQIEQQRVATVSKYASELQTALADEGSARVERGEDPVKVESNINKIYQSVEQKFGIKLARPAAPAEIKSNTALDTVIAKPDATKTGILPTLPGAKPAVPGQMTPEQEIAAGHKFSIYDGKPLTPSTSEVPAPILTTKPEVKAPAPVVTPAPGAPALPATPGKYTGVSIVEFLNTKGQDSSFATRKKLAEKNGIIGYTGTADQNTNLLKKLNI